MSNTRYQPNQELLLDQISRCAIGDKQAFQALYEETSSQLLGLLVRMLRSRDEAEDCLQDAYIQIWNNASQYHLDKGPVFSWMVTIARYRAIDRIRKERPNVEPETVEHLLAETPDFGGDHKLLLECLQQLPAETVEMIVKCYVEGYSQSELSKSNNTPLGTVKSWMRRGLAVLKQCMQPNG